ncbi:TRAP transporter substrate-binding protein [Marinivivus vitaminiproducens]|uniref:TRAP transporter substrate-binding protein n=1 Tax=Marinivivus vitaminiproducens TaxID=3035935 RepID=UPI0027A0CE04|nr:TRAP transporter substrate-binding protein [Geminicoccaceae bacterium SCSIO 64248]
MLSFKKTPRFATLAAAALAGALSAAPVRAEVPEMTVKGIGTNSKTLVSFGDEVPFWNETVPEASGGNISAEFTPVDLSGVKDAQVMRMISIGVVDFGAGDISKMSGDDPVFEGCDLAALTLDLDKARAACAAWAPVMDRVMQEKFNIKLLAFGGNPPQVFWCREPVTSLADLSGKKVRVFNRSMIDFIESLGGTTVSLAFAEVVPALQRGVVDCAVTGTLSGNTAGWPEVSGHLYNLSMGWSINFQAVNLDSWDSWDDETKAFFTDQFATFQDKMWNTLTMATEQGVRCNTGEDPCTLGQPVQMEFADVSDADETKAQDILTNTVLVEWGKRCGKDCAAEWNDTVGKAIGMSIPLDEI